MLQEYRPITNSQDVPFNIGLTKVRKLVRDSSELENLAIVMIKPGFYDKSVVDKPFHQLTEGLVTSVDLKCVCTAEKRLNQTEVKQLYSSIFESNNGQDERWLLELRNQITNFMTSGSVFSYVVTGENCSYKTKTIKESLRTLFCEDFVSKKIQNGIHTSDTGEFRKNLNILFNTK